MESNNLVDNARESFDIVAFRLVRGATRWLPARAAFWVRCTLVFSVFLLLIGAGMAATGENIRAFWLLGVFGASTILAELIVLELDMQAILTTLRDDIAPHLPAGALDKAAVRVKALFSPARQILFSLLLAALSTALLRRVILQFQGEYSVVDALAEFVLAAVLFNGVYLVVPLLSNVRLFEIGEADLYPLDPRFSPALRGSTAIVSRLLAGVAIIATVSILSLFVLVEIAALLAGMVMIIALVLVAGVQFAVQQASLSAMVARRKARTVAELQERLAAIYNNNAVVTDDDRKQFDYLLGLHDRVAKTGESALSFGTALRFIAPMLLPLVSFLSSTGKVPGLLGDLVTSILQALH